MKKIDDIKLFKDRNASKYKDFKSSSTGIDSKSILANNKY